MRGTMMDFPLTLQHIFERGTRLFPNLELYFAVPMLGSVLHTLNIRLFHDQLTYIVNHAEDRFIFVDRSLLPVIRQLQPTFKSVAKLIVIDDGGDNDPGDA